jgi:hypothetical protein
MRRASTVIGCSVIGTIITAVWATATIMYLMFSTDEATASKRGMFGAVYFKVAEKPGGATVGQLGVDNLATMGLIWLVVTSFIFLCYLTLQQLKAYKKTLQAAPQKPLS